MAQPARQKAPRNRGRTARTANKYELYEESVQCPDSDIKFLTRVFRKERGRIPLSLREDFCGTAYLCAEWVKSRKDRTAMGLDLHQPTLEWGRKTHVEPLGQDAARVQLLCKNVASVTRPPVDVCVAFNFSYCVFRERKELLRYLRLARRSLAPDGLFALDIHGGPEAHEAIEEETRHTGFTYVWDQEPIDALTHHAQRYIHFKFPDGSAIRRAFSYDWRVWSMPELRDLFEEAGFRGTEVYWEGYDEKSGEGNGIFRKVQRAENDESWIAYVLGWT